MSRTEQRKWRRNLLFAMVGAFCIWACETQQGAIRTGGSVASGASKLQDVQEVAPTFSLKDLGGRSHSLEQYKGKVVLINFWATWCEPCKKEFPHFQNLLNKYRSKGLEILAISIDEGRSVSSVGPTVRRFGYNFTVLLDTEGRVISRFNPKRHCPYSALVDRKGQIRMRHQGYNAGDEVGLERKIVALLREK